MLAQTETRRCNLSFSLAKETLSDPDTWSPNTSAVQVLIRVALATKRLDTDAEQVAKTSQQ